MTPADEAAFAEFVSTSTRHLREFAYLLCGDWHAAEEIEQLVHNRVDLLERGAFMKVALISGALLVARRAWPNALIHRKVGHPLAASSNRTELSSALPAAITSQPPTRGYRHCIQCAGAQV